MRIWLLATVALILVACSGKTEHTAAVHKPAVSVPAPTSGDDAVAAVLESQGTPLAQLRFLIDSRPVLGKPFNVKLIVSSSASLPQLFVATESDGLTIDPAKAALVLQDGGAGRGYTASHDFSVTAQDEGFAELTVHLTTDPDTPEAVYVIPVLVAKPGPAAAAAARASHKSDPAAAADHSQPQKG